MKSHKLTNAREMFFKNSRSWLALAGIYNLGSVIEDLSNLRWLPRVIVKHPPYRARVRKGNVVNSSLSFPRSD